MWDGAVMNLDKMRRQLLRGQPCGARFSPAPGAPVELCGRSALHRDGHAWPSLPADPHDAWLASINSSFRLSALSMKDLIGPHVRA
jgi:hypothetical protein